MIELKDLGMRFPGGTIALYPTSLKIKKGQFTVLLGMSGAGKSTLLRCLNLLNTPTSGKVSVSNLGTLNGNRKLLQRHRRHTAMIFQQHQLIGRYSALKNTLTGRIANYNSLRSLFPLPQKDQMIALECLDRVGLLDKALVRVDNLSGGQQQRVGIARGLAQQPKIILADEPVASLDPATSRKVLSLLYRICKEDELTAIVSLHQVELAKDFADRLIGLVDGKIAFDGQGHELSADVLDIIYHHQLQDKSLPPLAEGDVLLARTSIQEPVFEDILQ
jgi:phosphonate transport system ATP-binding protein